MPFLLFASIHSAGSHLLSPIGLSSKIVPSFTENCRPQSRHFQIRRVLRKPGFPASQAGQVTPFGQRSAERKVSEVPLSAKYRIASVSELGKCLSLAMQKATSRGLVCQVCYCPCQTAPPTEREHRKPPGIDVKAVTPNSSKAFRTSSVAVAP